MAAAARSWCFTVNNPATNDIAWDENTRYAVWQLEIGPNGTRHLQGYVEFPATKRRAGVLKLLPTAHCEPRRATRDQARAYCMKVESRVEGPWEHGSWDAGGSGTRNDIAAAIEALKMGGIKRAAEEHPEVFVKFSRGLRDLATVLRVREENVPRIAVLKQWQQQLADRLRELPHDREILWFVDVRGGAGKSYMAEYLLDNFDAIKLRGKDADILHAYNGQPIAIFDLARSERGSVPYVALEEIKNGTYFSGKYESSMRRNARPHVVVFSNFEPDRNALSADRLVVTYLE